MAVPQARPLNLHERLHVRLWPDKSLPGVPRFKTGKKWEVDRILQLKSKVVVLMYNLDDEQAVLVEDDAGLFPSDQLIVKIRTLD